MNGVPAQVLPQPRGRKTGWPWEVQASECDAGNAGSSAAADYSMRLVQWPKITVVTPSFNQGRYLEETIRSVLMQGYPNLEYIVMDGGSADDSVPIIRKYEPHLAHWVSEKDRGQSDAINRGWERSQGDILAYLNSDDVYEPGVLRRVATYCAEHPEADLVCGDYSYMDEGGRVYGKFHAPEVRLDALLLGNYVSQPSVFIRRSAWRKIGPLDNDLHYVMDHDYWIRAALAGLRFGNTGCPHARMRMHAVSKTIGSEHTSWEEEVRILEGLFSGDRLPSELAILKCRALMRARWAWSVCLARAGDYAGARRQAATATSEYQVDRNIEDLDFAFRYVLQDGKDTLRSPWAFRRILGALALRSDCPAFCAAAEEEYVNRLLRKKTGRWRKAADSLTALTAFPGWSRKWAVRHALLLMATGKG